MKRRFLVQAAMAIASGLLFLLTVLWRDWIEIVFGVNPDHGNGSLEWGFVVVSLAVTVTFAALARNEWRKASLAVR